MGPGLMGAHTEESYAYANTNPTGLFGAVYNTQRFRAWDNYVIRLPIRAGFYSMGTMVPHTSLSFLLRFSCGACARTSCVRITEAFGRDDIRNPNYESKATPPTTKATTVAPQGGFTVWSYAF